jgi:hypothetical protein
MLDLLEGRLEATTLQLEMLSSAQGWWLFRRPWWLPRDAILLRAVTVAAGVWRIAARLHAPPRVCMPRPGLPRLRARLPNPGALWLLLTAHPAAFPDLLSRSRRCACRRFACSPHLRLYQASHSAAWSGRPDKALSLPTQPVGRALAVACRFCRRRQLPCARVAPSRAVLLSFLRSRPAVAPRSHPPP